MVAGFEFADFAFISLHNEKKRIIINFHLSRRRNLHFLMPAFFVVFIVDEVSAPHLDQSPGIRIGIIII